MNNEIAVIIAAYRGERVIGRAVRSALAQPETAEIVVVVDASPDATADAARAADDGSNRLQIIELAANQGPAAARNVGFAATRSPWVTILDDDDYMQPGRLARLRALADDCDIVADDLWLADESDPMGALNAMWFTGPAAPRKLSLAEFVAANCPDPARPRRELGFLKPLIRRAFLNQHNLRYDEQMRLGEDYDLYARALAAGAKFRLVSAQGYVAVRRGASLSANHGTRELCALRAADDRLLRAQGLSPADRAAIHAHRQTSDERYQWQRLIDSVKTHNLVEALACFGSTPRTSAHLIGQLWTQVRLRAARA